MRMLSVGIDFFHFCEGYWLAFKRNADKERSLTARWVTGTVASAQSRQSAKRFSSRWNWDSPTPLAADECAPPPFGPGGGRAHSLAAKGVRESQVLCGRRSY